MSLIIDNINDSSFEYFRMCFLGNRLLKEEHSGNCTKEEGSPLWNLFCSLNNRTLVYECDPYFEAHSTSMVRGVKGLQSGVFFGKFGQKYFTWTTVRALTWSIRCFRNVTANYSECQFFWSVDWYFSPWNQARW